MLDLFIFVILPIYLLLIFSLVNFYVYKYKTFKQKEISPKLLTISQYAMIIKELWLLVGFTIWSLRNVVWTIILFERDCIRNNNA